MMRSMLRGKARLPKGGSGSGWQVLHTQYRRMTQAIRFGDLTEAKDAHDRIRLEQAEHPELSAEARLAFDALGEAIESGSLADAADGLRLFRLVLEGTSQARSTSQPSGSSSEHPTETPRSGVIPAYGSSVGSELPETATIQDIDVTG